MQLDRHAGQPGQMRRDFKYLELKIVLQAVGIK